MKCGTGILEHTLQEVLVVGDSCKELVTEVARIELLTEGVQGPPGPPGPQGPSGGVGGSIYEHHQPIASMVWTVAHNLGRRPSVSVTDNLGQIITGDVRYIDSNIIQIIHSVPTVGHAYFN